MIELVSSVDNIVACIDMLLLVAASSSLKAMMFCDNIIDSSRSTSSGARFQNFNGWEMWFLTFCCKYDRFIAVGGGTTTNNDDRATHRGKKNDRTTSIHKVVNAKIIRGDCRCNIDMD